MGKLFLFKMRNYRRVSVEEEMIDSVTCNKCTRVIDFENEEYFSINVDWSSSSKWGGFSHEFDLCQVCYGGIINSFIDPVTVKRFDSKGDDQRLADDYDGN